jgi:hypothetical protein
MEIYVLKSTWSYLVPRRHSNFPGIRTVQYLCHRDCTKDQQLNHFETCDIASSGKFKGLYSIAESVC